MIFLMFIGLTVSQMQYCMDYDIDDVNVPEREANICDLSLAY